MSKDSTDYIGDFVYHNNKFSRYNWGYGYIVPAGSSSGYAYRFYFKDHQGNNRVVTIEERERPEYVGAAHEFIHGIRDMKGEAVRGTSVGYNYKDLDNNVRYGQESLEELQTVGLMGNYRYTENRIRKEHGLRLRRMY